MTKPSNAVPIDVDDSTTWPSHIYETVSRWAERCSGSTRYTNDLPLSLDEEKPFRELFAGYLLRAYHYTRLLEHERAMVLSMGLRLLSVELLSDRIESARTVGAISGAEAAEFHQAHVFATSEQQNREGQVCLSLSRRVFERDMEACRPLLETWGGEGMYMSFGAVSQRERLKRLGSPTIVVALIELGGQRSNHLVFPALHRVFVGALLGLLDVGADVFYRAPVPSEHIESLEEIALQ
jgi:hypothetical protein